VQIVISASCGIEGTRVVPYKPLLDEAIHLAQHKACIRFDFAMTESVQPPATILVQRPAKHAHLDTSRDIEWKDAMRSFGSHQPCTSVAATDPLYVIYTSGTTGLLSTVPSSLWSASSGKPKGIVRENGGHAVALHFALDMLYGITPDDVWWAASDIGWVVCGSLSLYLSLSLYIYIYIHLSQFHRTAGRAFVYCLRTVDHGGHVGSLRGKSWFVTFIARHPKISTQLGRLMPALSSASSSSTRCEPCSPPRPCSAAFGKKTHAASCSQSMSLAELCRFRL
jgi:hypothetical protein